MQLQTHGGEVRIRAKIAWAGHFGFAGHDDPVMFRNISIKRLE